MTESVARPSPNIPNSKQRALISGSLQHEHLEDVKRKAKKAGKKAAKLARRDSEGGKEVGDAFPHVRKSRI